MRDAEAIAEAVTRPTMRFVPPGDQQDIKRCTGAWKLVERTALINEVHGLLNEYGIVIPQGCRSSSSRGGEAIRAGQTYPGDVLEVGEEFAAAEQTLLTKKLDTWPNASESASDDDPRDCPDHGDSAVAAVAMSGVLDGRSLRLGWVGTPRWTDPLVKGSARGR
jgi:transposase